MSSTETGTWRRDPDLPFQKLDEDTIVVDPRRREVHLLNETAARIWELLESPHTIDQLAARLAEEYEGPLDELRQSAEELLTQLGEKGVFVRP